MRGTIVLEVAPWYPDGTEVGLYLRTQFVEGREDPIGVPITSSFVAGGELSFGGLEENVDYLAAAEVGGVWQKIAFLGTDTGEDDDHVYVAPIGTESFGHGVMSRLENNLADVRILFLGDSTGAQIVYPDPYPRKIARQLAEMFPTFTVNYHYWSEADLVYNGLDEDDEPNPPEVFQVGVGDPVHGLHTLDVYNGCASGERVDYHLGHFADQVQVIQPHLTSMFHGHNHGAPFAPRLREDLVKGLAEVQRANPRGELVNGPQNPRFYNLEDPPNPDHPVNEPWEAQDQFGFELAQLSREMGMGYVDIWQGFYDYTGGNLTRIRGMLGDDNLHPREEGQELWAKLWMDRFQAARGSQPRPLPTPALTIPARNHALNGLLPDWETVTTIPDVSGNGNDATSGGAPTFGNTIGRWLDSATDFTTDDVIHVPNVLAQQGKDLVLLITVRPPDNTGGGLFGAVDADGPILQHVAGSDTARFDPQRLGAASAINWTNVLAPNTFKTLLLHYDDVTKITNLIVNGTLATPLNQVAAEGISATPGIWDIGSFGNGTNFMKERAQHAAIWTDWQGGLAAAQTLATNLEDAVTAISGAAEEILPFNPDAYFTLTNGVPVGEVPAMLGLNNVTAAKDLVNFETGTYGLKLTKVGDGSAFAFKKLVIANMGMLRGGHVAMCGRMRIAIDEDNRGFVGRVGLNIDGTLPPDDDGGIIPATQISNDVATGKEVFKWSWVSRYVPHDASFLTYFLYANRNSEGAAEVTFDRFGLFAGDMLRDPYA